MKDGYHKLTWRRSVGVFSWRVVDTNCGCGASACELNVMISAVIEAALHRDPLKSIANIKREHKLSANLQFHQTSTTQCGVTVTSHNDLNKPR